MKKEFEDIYAEVLKLLYTYCTEDNLKKLLYLSRIIWQPYDNTYGYVDEKMAVLDSVDTSRPDSIWPIYNMFDPPNQRGLRDLVNQTESDDMSDLNIIMMLLDILGRIVLSNIYGMNTAQEKVMLVMIQNQINKLKGEEDERS